MPRGHKGKAAHGHVENRAHAARSQAIDDVGRDARPHRLLGETRFGAVDGRFEALDARFSRVDARFAQLEAQLDRSLREQTRTLTLGLIGAMFTMTSLCLGATALVA